MNLEELLKERNAQILATTEAEREEGNEENLILNAETAPNRFNIMSFFFTDNDGVNIEEDLDTNTFIVKFFTDDGEIEVSEGTPLYDWVMAQYEENF
jgi:hypothetical protein